MASAPDLARQTDVPPNYLAKVLQMLAQTGLVVGRRGVGGGYRLARDPAEVTLLDVVNAVGPLSNPSRRREGGYPEERSHLGRLDEALASAALGVEQALSRVTLADLAGRGSEARHAQPGTRDGSDPAVGFNAERQRANGRPGGGDGAAAGSDGQAALNMNSRTGETRLRPNGEHAAAPTTETPFRSPAIA